MGLLGINNGVSICHAGFARQHAAAASPAGALDPPDAPSSFSHARGAVGVGTHPIRIESSGRPAFDTPLNYGLLLGRRRAPSASQRNWQEPSCVVLPPPPLCPPGILLPPVALNPSTHPPTPRHAHRPPRRAGSGSSQTSARDTPASAASTSSSSSNKKKHPVEVSSRSPFQRARTMSSALRKLHATVPPVARVHVRRLSGGGPPAVSSLVLVRAERSAFACARARTGYYDRRGGRILRSICGLPFHASIFDNG